MKKSLLLFFSILLLPAFTSFAQEIKTVSYKDFVKECTKSDGQIPNLKVVQWIPQEFWKIVGTEIKMPPELMIRIETEMSRYLFFIVTESMDSSRNIGFKSDEEIRKSIKLTDRLNNQYDPVDPKDISSGVSKLLSLLKPSLQKIFGEFGKGGRFFLFNSVLKDKQEPINVTKINTFKLSLEIPPTLTPFYQGALIP